MLCFDDDDDYLFFSPLGHFWNSLFLLNSQLAALQLELEQSHKSKAGHFSSRHLPRSRGKGAQPASCPLRSHPSEGDWGSSSGWGAQATCHKVCWGQEELKYGLGLLQGWDWALGSVRTQVLGWGEMSEGSPLSLALVRGARGCVRLLPAASRHHWDKQKSQVVGVSGVRMEVYTSAGVRDRSGCGLRSLAVVTEVIQVVL